MLVPSIDPPGESVSPRQGLPPAPTFFPTTTADSAAPVSTPALPQLFRIVTGFVFVDLDGDGRRSANEASSTGAFVTITFPDGTRRTVVSDEQGRYAFAAVPIGRMTIDVLSNGLTRQWTVDVLSATTRLDVAIADEPTTLAFTGQHSRTELAVAVVLLVLGSALVTGAGRRRRHSIPR